MERGFVFAEVVTLLTTTRASTVVTVPKSLVWIWDNFTRMTRMATTYMQDMLDVTKAALQALRSECFADRLKKVDCRLQMLRFHIEGIIVYYC